MKTKYLINHEEGETVMEIAMNTVIFALLNFALLIAFNVLIIYLLILVIRALKKYLNESKNKEQVIVRKTLGETLKEHRTRCKMTQEFVAEHIGVSRQAVSKWENGTSDPSTSNLIALAKLFDVPVEELLKNIEM